jgi:uncharacterized DUF497 family protein
VARITIYFLEFDDHNVEHLARHAIAPEEIEQLTGNPYVTARNPRVAENRIFMIGRTDGGRMLTIVLEATHDDATWRPITGWDATPAERGILKGD